MEIIQKIKKNLLNKSLNKFNADRTIIFKPINEYKNILAVVNSTNQSQQILEELKTIFTNADISILKTRSKKEDESKGNIFTFHSSDLGFGNLKNEKLLKLLKRQFDLVIDFNSKKSDLDFLIRNVNSFLKAGSINSENNYMYDLLLEKNSSTIKYIKNLKEQITILNND